MAVPPLKRSMNFLKVSTLRLRLKTLRTAFLIRSSTMCFFASLLDALELDFAGGRSEEIGKVADARYDIFLIQHNRRRRALLISVS